MDDISYYDWVPYFNELVAAIHQFYVSPERDHQLYLKAQEVFQPDDPVLRYPYLDPFSFIYALAQRNTVNQRAGYFLRVKDAFGMASSIPTDYIFPTPIPTARSLFYAKGKYIGRDGREIGNRVIWDLFNSIFTGTAVDDNDFQEVLALKNVGLVKLTQVMFLVNPTTCIPFDTQMNSLPIPELENLKLTAGKIEDEGFAVYLESIGLLRKAFPGCKLYEINLLNVLINSPYDDQLLVSGKHCQISSWAEGQNDEDYFNQFAEDSAVWTGGPAGLTGYQKYPLTSFDRGDIVLVRRGTKRLGGIGIILSNGYIPGGFDGDAVIKIVWLVKNERWIDETALGQRIGFGAATDITLNRFKELYPATFQILQQIRKKQRTMVNHSLNKHKNIILAGPPGTGKTRKALQIAQWLTTGEAHTMPLMQAIDDDIFIGDPDIEHIEEAELIQFHPSYSYEDFVRGITTHAKGKKISYKVENKSLAKMAYTASLPENSHKAYVLVIDEINRANLSAVLGELIYALEYRGKAVQTLYAYEGSNQLILPENLYIIGTMNTADRSVGHIDYAIRRRFSFVPVLPNINAIVQPKAKALYQRVFDLFEQFTGSDFEKDDVRIGHSYFLGNDDELWLKLKYEIRPLLLEYVRDGVLSEAARGEILDLHV